MSAPERRPRGCGSTNGCGRPASSRPARSRRKLVGKRRVRINQAIVTKAHHRIRPGDVLTFLKGPSSVVRVVDLGSGAARRARRRACTRRSPER